MHGLKVLCTCMTHIKEHKPQWIGAAAVVTRDPATAKVQLIRQALIGSDEQIKLRLGQREQFAVLYAFPTHFLRAAAFMTDKQFAQG